MREGKNKYLLDTSAIFCLRDKEAEFEKVKHILEKARHAPGTALVSFMSLMEFYYVIYSRRGAKEAQEAYEELMLLPIKVIESGENLGLLAGELKANYNISVADAWIAAAAVAENAVLVHKDPEFEPLEDMVECLPLPYK